MLQGAVHEPVFDQGQVTGRGSSEAEVTPDLSAGAQNRFSRTFDDRCLGPFDRTSGRAEYYGDQTTIAALSNGADRKSMRFPAFRIWLASAVIESAGEPICDHFQMVEVEQDGKRFLLRSEVQGTCGKVFQAAGVALPPTVQQVSPTVPKGNTAHSATPLS